MTIPQEAVSKHRASQEPALDERKASILEAVVAEYIGTAQPVGSHHVAEAAGLNCSSATIRSDMVALEHEGYLAQPHTSAGRIPTDKGYRFFVDNLAGSGGVLGAAERQKVRRFFDQMHGEMEGLLEQASGLLSELTQCAAVVVGPSHDGASIRSLQLVGLGQRVALLVVVRADGAVGKRRLDFDSDVSEAHLGAATTHLQRQLQGRVLAEVGAMTVPAPPEIGDIVIAAVRSLADMSHEGESDQVYVGGPLRLASAFDAVDTVRNVLSILEQQLVIVSLIRDVLDRGLSVAIGTEHGFEPLASCAVVVAPVSVGGLDTGAVGLLGPTRMNYPQALAAAHLVGQRLGERLEDSNGVRGGNCART